VPVRESIYFQPDGFVDEPFFYVFDGSTLTDGTTPTVQAVTIQGDSDFILRAILGVPNVINAAGGFQLFNYSGSQAFGGYYSPFTSHYAVVPEKFYPRNGQIKFNLQNVLRANTACATGGAIYYSQIGFQGVRRYRPAEYGYAPGNPALPQPFDATKYVQRPWYYILNLNLNWFAWTAAGLPEIPRTFIVEVQDYDFELHNITAVNTATNTQLSTELMQLQLYDATAKRQLSTLPVNLGYINYNTTKRAVFPVPPIIYPVWTQIRVDVSSLVCNSDVNSPYSIQLIFSGVNRIPKLGQPTG
jgi:hypothetical protein